MTAAMKVSIDSSGRLVVPKQLREAAGLEPGMPLEIRLHDGRLEIEPGPRKVRLEWHDDVLVAVPEEPGEPLTQEVVERTRQELRERHVES